MTVSPDFSTRTTSKLGASMAGIVAPASAGITLAVAAEAAVSPDGGLAGSAADDEDGSEAAGAGGRGFTCTTGAPLSPASA
jgi:hypothetical protein